MIVTLAGQAQFVAVVAEITRLGAGLAGLYLTVTLVVSLAQSHLGSISGQPHVLADMLDRIIPVLICFAVAVTANELGSRVSQIVTTATATDAPGALSLWQALAGFVVNTVIYSVGASLAAGFATGAFSAQLAVFAGKPNALSQAQTRLGLTVLTAVLTLVSVTLAQAILRAAL